MTTKAIRTIRSSSALEQPNCPPRQNDLGDNSRKSGVVITPRKCEEVDLNSKKSLK